MIAGLRLDTSHNGTDVGPNRNENGPRWRILELHPDLGEMVGQAPAGVVRGPGRRTPVRQNLVKDRAASIASIGATTACRVYTAKGDLIGRSN